jgi:hypothetical protein
MFVFIRIHHKEIIVFLYLKRSLHHAYNYTHAGLIGTGLIDEGVLPCPSLIFCNETYCTTIIVGRLELNLS